jgi:hypothetical protein
VNKIRDREMPCLIAKGGGLQLFGFVSERGSCHQFTLDTAK